MFPRHARHLGRCFLGGPRDVDEDIVEEIQIVDGREGFPVAFGREVGFGVWGCDDGEGAAEGGFDFGVEVVADGVVRWGWCCEFSNDAMKEECGEAKGGGG